MDCVAPSVIEDLKKDLTLIIAVIGGIVAGLVAIAIVIVVVACMKVSKIKKQLDLTQISIRSIQKDIGLTLSAIDRFPKNIVQFPMSNKSVIDDDDDRAGTEPASPIFYRKGFTPTPLASSLHSVTEIPAENQMIHHPLQRSNAGFHARPKQVGPPVPPKRANSFSPQSYNY